MTRLIWQSWVLVTLICAMCAQNPLFAQEDSNASIIAGLDSNASELAGARGRDLVPRRNSGGSIQHGASQARKSFQSGMHYNSQATAFGPASRTVNSAAVGFESFGIRSNQGGLEMSTFRVYGQGYGFGFSRSYFGNYGQGYGTGYSRNYFGNYGYGYGIGYGPKQ